jgi:hypothetical protein
VRSQLSRLKVTEEAREAVLAYARPGIKGTYDLYDYLDEKRERLSFGRHDYKRSSHLLLGTMWCNFIKAFDRPGMFFLCPKRADTQSTAAEKIKGK